MKGTFPVADSLLSAASCCRFRPVSPSDEDDIIRVSERLANRVPVFQAWGVEIILRHADLQTPCPVT
jgi:hypothetical protein